MTYLMKAGTLFEKETLRAQARVKASWSGPEKKITDCSGSTLLEAGFLFPDGRYLRSGDVRDKEYVLTDPLGGTVASARPMYAEGSLPEEGGWPLGHVPAVDHAALRLDGAEYALRMEDGGHYAMYDEKGRQILEMTHKGLSSGWRIETGEKYPPEILCGIFVFFRYIEKENEIMIV